MCAWFGTTAAGKKAKLAVHSKRRRVREQAATPEGDAGIDRMAIFHAHNGLCVRCKLPVPEEDFELDHVEPLSRGGLHTAGNLAPIHPKCNQRKGNRGGPRKKGLRRTPFRKKAPPPLPTHTDDGEEFF